MAQVWKVKLPDGRVMTPGDWTTFEPLYSTVEFGTAAFTVQSLFSYGRGAAVPGSSGARQSNLADTNLEGEGARLPENEELVIYNIALEAFSIGTNGTDDTVPEPDAPLVSLNNMLRMQRDLLIVLRIAAVKEYTRSPISYWPASTGVIHYNSSAKQAAGANGWVASNNGSPEAADCRKLSSPLYVAGGETFVVDLRPGPGVVTGLNLAGATDRIRIRCYLDGYRRRPVA